MELKLELSSKAVSSESPITILLVDDELLEFKVLELKLASTPEFKLGVDYAATIAEAVLKVRAGDYQMILVDNRLFPNNDFRETVPQLRRAGYTGPIGVISADISDAYFQQFPQYGVDFRIGKDELDYHAIRHIIGEYVNKKLPDDWYQEGVVSVTENGLSS